MFQSPLPENLCSNSDLRIPQDFRLDSIRMLVLQPHDKLKQARTVLSTWRKRPGASISYWRRVIAPGRTFLHRMIALTCGVKQPYVPFNCKLVVL